MENKDDILQALEEFARKPSEKIPPILDQFLLKVSVTGETMFPWTKVKAVFVQKLDQAMTQFNADIPVVDDTPVPNVENIHFDMHRKRVLKAVNAFTAAPFTIQRLCELITNPRKHYCITDKFMRGLEKNVQVVSTVDPFGNKIVCESKSMYNGMDANGYNENNGKHADDSATFNSPFLPPPPPSSAQVSPSGIPAWQLEPFAGSPQSSWPAAGVSSPKKDSESEPEVASGTDIRAAIAQCKSGESSKDAAEEGATSDPESSEGNEYEPAAKKQKIDHSSEESSQSSVSSSVEDEKGGSESDSSSSLDTEDNEPEEEPEVEKTSPPEEVKASDIVQRHDSGGFETNMSEDEASSSSEQPMAEEASNEEAMSSEESKEQSLPPAEHKEDTQKTAEESHEVTAENSESQSEAEPVVVASTSESCEQKPQDCSPESTASDKAAVVSEGHGHRGDGDASSSTDVQQKLPSECTSSSSTTDSAAAEPEESHVTPDSSDAENSQESASSTSSSAEEAMETD